MTPREKIAFVKKRIKEQAQTHPSGAFHIELVPIVDIEANGGIPDDAPVLLSRKEQWSIIQKLGEEGFVQNLELDEDGRGVRLELEKPKKRRSNLLSHIKTADELLQHRELLDRFLGLIRGVGEISPKGYYKIPVDEAYDDLVQLLIDLKIVDYDWSEMDKQTHRQVGNRIIELGFSGAAILKLRDRISGKGGRIKREALELVCKDIGERFTFDKIRRLCTDLGVPETMFVHDTKWRALFYVLSYLTTSEAYEDYLLALKIVQETLHPLMFKGDDEKAKETREKYKQWLKYDRIEIDETGKVFVCPTSEEFDVGIQDWMSVDGKTFEPKGYLIDPERIAELWVLWSQAIVLVQAYQSNSSLDRKALEKLYLDLISKAEDLIGKGEIGNLAETYKRPFTSLATAEIEAIAKGADSPLGLVSTLLLEIISMEPPPQEIAKKMEEHAQFIEEIITATRTISDEEIDPEKLSHEQAIFILKLVVSRLHSILEAFSTGYMIMTDEQLNAQYITLLDQMNGLLKREDFAKLDKEIIPLPEHLFEWMDGMDVWWENGGQSRMMGLYGDIELLWVRAGQQVFPIPRSFGTYLDTVDETVKSHRKTKSARWQRELEDIDRRKAAGEFGFTPSEPKANEPQKVVHEHTHRFENGDSAVPLKMEITGMPELKIRSVEDESIAKGKKRVYPPKFTSTEWTKVSIRFISERDVVITAGAKQVSSDFEALGFGNAKSGKPNSAWMFLLGLAKNGGATDTLPTPIPDNIKQHKKTISDRLKTLFKNETDPFDDPTDTHVYRVKLALIAPEAPDTTSDTLGVQEYLSETMTEKYEPDE